MEYALRAAAVSDDVLDVRNDDKAAIRRKQIAGDLGAEAASSAFVSARGGGGNTHRMQRERFIEWAVNNLCDRVTKADAHSFDEAATVTPRNTSGASSPALP